MNEYEAIVVGQDSINMLSMIRGLGREKKIFLTVIICDDRPRMCIKSKYLKNFVICNANEMFENLCNIGKKIKYKVPILCCDDLSAYIVDKNLSVFSQYFYCPSIDMCEGKICQMMDKYEQYLFTQKYKIDMAKTYVISLGKITDVMYEYPLILKPRFSAFGHKSDICMVDNEEELYQAINIFRNKGYKDILAQNFINIDYECTFYGVILGTKTYTCNGVKKILRWPRVGAGTVFTTTIEPSNLIRQILNHLGEMGYVGMYDIELYVKDEKYILNEINFRHTGLGYVELSNGVNSGRDLIDYFNGYELCDSEIPKRIYSINSRELISMLMAREVSILNFIKIETISRSHSIFAFDDPMPCISAFTNRIITRGRKYIKRKEKANRINKAV